MNAEITSVYEPRTSDHLLELCGPNHRYLQILESKLDAYNLRAESQGGHISLRGSREGVSIAEAALAEMEKRIKSGAPLSTLEVEGAIEAARAPDGAFDSTLTGLKKPITAKTRGQASYLSICPTRSDRWFSEPVQREQGKHISRWLQVFLNFCPARASDSS